MTDEPCKEKTDWLKGDRECVEQAEGKCGGADGMLNSPIEDMHHLWACHHAHTVASRFTEHEVFTEFQVR